VSIQQLIEQCERDEATYLQHAKVMRCSSMAEARAGYVGRAAYARVMAGRLRELQAEVDAAALAAEVHRPRARKGKPEEQVKLTQENLGDVTAVLDAAEKLCGSHDEAVAWYNSHGIHDLGGITASRAVEQGSAKAVLDYIESISAGAAG
jgi:hypothetical protein